MKTYLANIIPKIQKFSEKLDNEALLTSKHWVLIDDTRKANFVYIFRSNSDLLLSENGKVKKGKWEYVGSQSLYTEIGEDRRLFKHGFLDESIMALKVGDTEEFAFLASEEIFSQNGLDTIGGITNHLELKLIEETTRIEEKERIRAAAKARVKKDDRDVLYIFLAMALGLMLFGLLSS